MRIVIATLSILFTACILLVIVFNQEKVTLQLWPHTPDYTFPETPVGAVIFVSAFLGFTFSGIIFVLEGSKARLSNARLRAHIKRLQAEIDTLRRPSMDFPGTSSPAVREIVSAEPRFEETEVENDA